MLQNRKITKLRQKIEKYLKNWYLHSFWLFSRLKRYQMIICHVIHKSKKFWNCASWWNHRFLRNYLIWKTKLVKNCIRNRINANVNGGRAANFWKCLPIKKKAKKKSQFIDWKVWTTNFCFLFFKKMDEIWFFTTITSKVLIISKRQFLFFWTDLAII